MIAAQQARIAKLAAQVAALTAQIIQLQRDLYSSRSERRGDGVDGSDDNEAASVKDGRKKERGDAVNNTGLRFNGQAPVIDIAVTPPEIKGLSDNDHEVVSERVHCQLAALECRHVVIRYHHVTVKIRATGALAREGVFKNSYADETSSVMKILLSRSTDRKTSRVIPRPIKANAIRPAPTAYVRGSDGPGGGCAQTAPRSRREASLAPQAPASQQPPVPVSAFQGRSPQGPAA